MLLSKRTRCYAKSRVVQKHRVERSLENIQSFIRGGRKSDHIGRLRKSLVKNEIVVSIQDTILTLIPITFYINHLINKLVTILLLLRTFVFLVVVSCYSNANLSNILYAIWFTLCFIQTVGNRMDRIMVFYVATQYAPLR